MDPSKAYINKSEYTINHNLLLAKLDTCGFSRKSLELMQNYSCNRQQRSSKND